MRSICVILVSLVWVCSSCQWRLKSVDDEVDVRHTSVQRYDRIESLYLTTGDYSALQQMNTYFPTQTRMLIEDVLRLGKANDKDINTRFLYFFQDSTLQRMLVDVQREYADVSDIDDELATAFRRLHEALPSLPLPEVYAQIGSFDQSIIVGNGTLGISLDKYLGADYPFYLTHYTEEQRRLMTRAMIVPDCVAFFILSQFPLAVERRAVKRLRDEHMARIQWVVNHIVGRKVFTGLPIDAVDEYVKKHSSTMEQLLEDGGRM